MGSSGLITAADAHVLRLYCEAWSRYRQAADMLGNSAPLLNDRGHLTKNPLHQVVRDNADHVRLLARELGLTPPLPARACSSFRARRHRTSTPSSVPRHVCGSWVAPMAERSWSRPFRGLGQPAAGVLVDSRNASSPTGSSMYVRSATSLPRRISDTSMPRVTRRSPAAVVSASSNSEVTLEHEKTDG
jgi:hypothetical protein